jgi:hypothetical protein
MSQKFLSGLPPRIRILVLSVAAFTTFLLLDALAPSSYRVNPLASQTWSSASASVLRSRFLRQRAGAPRAPIHHPIPKMMADARRAFDSKLKRQSKTLEQAVGQYETRYGRRPPAGFDEWFDFAQENGATIIDEYDQLAKDLEPFWQMSGAELRRRCIQVGFLPSVDLVRVEKGKTRTIDVSKGFHDSEVGARAKGFRVMLEKFQDRLPDMDFPINEKAEGRILVPWEEQRFPNTTADSEREWLLGNLGRQC